MPPFASRPEVSRRDALFALAALPAAAAVDPETPAPAGGCRLGGTFLQPTNAMAALSESAWGRLFGEFASLGIENLFLQWTALDRTAFFPSVRFSQSRPALLAAVSALAARAGMRVWVGLHLDTGYWKAIADAAGLPAYLDGRLRLLAGMLSELRPAIADLPFAGWYVADEIDDGSWRETVRRGLLERYLRRTVDLLRERRPTDASVAISGFANASSDPAAVAGFWADLLPSTGIDLLLFQDGVGEGKLGLTDVPRYYGALAPAVRAAGAELGGVVELFSLMPDGRRVPGPAGRIRSQIAAAGACGFSPVAFSVPDYMSVLGGARAAELLAQFSAATDACGI